VHDSARCRRILELLRAERIRVYPGVPYQFEVLAASAEDLGSCFRSVVSFRETCCGTEAYLKEIRGAEAQRIAAQISPYRLSHSWVLGRNGHRFEMNS